MSGELIGGLFAVVGLVLAPVPFVLALDLMHQVAARD